MELTGKLTVFVNDYKTKEGEIVRRYSTSIHKKEQDGSFKNCSLAVQFAKANFPAENLAKLKETEFYTFEVSEGFLSVDCWKDGTNHPMIIVKEAKLTDKGIRNIKPVKKAKPVEKKAEAVDDDLPF